MQRCGIARQPFEEWVLETIGLAGSERVLDVGRNAD